MPKSSIKELIETTYVAMTIWSIGWIISQLNAIRKWTPFRTWIFIINIVLSGWVWLVLDGVLSTSLDPNMRVSIISIWWALSFKFIDWLEAEWFNLLLQKVWLKK